MALQSGNGISLLAGKSEVVRLRSEVDELRRLLVEHQVLFFRDQALTPEQHQDFGASFGALLLHPTFAFIPGFPAVNVLDNGRENPSKIDKWHSDMTFTEKPPGVF